MDPNSLCVCLILLGLLLDSCDSIGEPCQCPCPQPLNVPLTEPPQAEDCCQRGGTYRYTCVDGYVRKAGRSNLVKCRQTDRGPVWSDPDLLCIPDPRRAATTTAAASTTTSTPPSSTHLNTTETTLNTTEKSQYISIQQVNLTTNSTGSDALNSKATNDTLYGNKAESRHGSGAVRNGLSALGALIVLSILCAILYLSYKRRSQNNNNHHQQQQQAEEMRHMNGEEDESETPTRESPRLDEGPEEV